MKKSKDDIAEMSQKVKRVYGNQQEFDSDTFKLQIASFMKNISFDDNNPLLQGVEHCHFYHTYDSGGKKCTHSCKVGGHQHKIDIKLDENNNLVGICGPAIGGMDRDTHTHDVTYIKSDKVQRRRYTPEAQRSIDSFSRI